MVKAPRKSPSRRTKSRPAREVRDCVGFLVFGDIVSAEDGNERLLPLLRQVQQHAEMVGLKVRLVDPFKVEVA